MTIYFIQESGNPRGPIKIGFTDRPVEERLADIQPCSPVRLAILKVIEGDTTQEAALHNRFDAFRLHGEWFVPDSSLLDFIYNPNLAELIRNPEGIYRNLKTNLRARLAEVEAKRGNWISAEGVRFTIWKRYGKKIRCSTVRAIMNSRPQDVNRDHLFYICNVLGYTVEEVIIQ